MCLTAILILNFMNFKNDFHIIKPPLRKIYETFKINGSFDILKNPKILDTKHML